MEIKNNSISIFPKRKDLHGIFALLYNITQKYSSRYFLDDGSTTTFNVTSLDKYYADTKQHYFSITGIDSFKITFDAPFLLSGYSISNIIRYGSNTFPHSWEIYGQSLTNENIYYLLDSQEKVFFCRTNNYLCNDEQILTFDTTKVYKSQRAFKTFKFKQIKNSGSYDYILMRAIDLYGTLCGKDQSCSFIHFMYRSKKSKRTIPSVHIIFITFTIKN